MKLEFDPFHKPGANHVTALRTELGQPEPRELMSPLVWVPFEEVMNNFRHSVKLL